MSSLIKPLLALSLVALAFGQGSSTLYDLQQRKDPQVEKLIDQLTKMNQWSVGLHPTALVDQFVAIDEEPGFGGGILGSSRPVVNPNVRKLVQMGTRALPCLIDHLQDSRPTKLKIGYGQDPYLSMWFGKEYSPRTLDAKRQSEVVTKLMKERTIPFDATSDPFTGSQYSSKYTFTVADVCYVIIGQIVNRGLTSFRYQPTLCGVINSPIHEPRLAEAVKADWANLSKAEHRKQLEEDIAVSDRFAGSALKRLMYYYPEAGERKANQLLQRAFYDPSPVNAFIDDELVKTDQPDLWRSLIANATRKLGTEVAKTFPAVLARSYSSSDKVLEARAESILATIYPIFDRYHPDFVNLVRVYDQTDIVKSLSAFPNVRIDEAVYGVFHRACGIDFSGLDAKLEKNRRFNVRQLKIACMERLSKPTSSPKYHLEAKRYLRSISPSER